jgi:lipopolysaccharide export system permease protein
MALFLFRLLRMKKIDKLIIGSFVGPFMLTFLVVDFILLNINMLKYYDDIIGKDLGFDTVATLYFYFAIFNTPIALPLAVLLSSLITFGNLGEHFELTAIKSLGVSLIRALVPIFGLVIIITGFAFLANNYMVPKAALEAFSLMYDIKQKKPSLDLREGAFYGGIPDVSIKVKRKYPDGIALKGVVIYDHRNRSGNREVTVADSGRMFTILNNRYLKFELFHGYNYSEGGTMERDIGQSGSRETFSKTQFGKTYMVFDLSSFGLQSTEKKWFKSNRIMRNVAELDSDMDSVKHEIDLLRLSVFEGALGSDNPLVKSLQLKIPTELEAIKTKRDTVTLNGALQPVSTGGQSRDSLRANGASKLKLGKHFNKKPAKVTTGVAAFNVDTILQVNPSSAVISVALSSARGVKSLLLNTIDSLKSQRYELNVFHIQWHKILANSAACLVMFLIGAPLGSIIKKGGLGVPVLTSIIFFILFYVMSLMGEKWAKQEVISVSVGIWSANAILFLFGLVFLRQARVDARLFESDFYQVMAEKLRRRFSKKEITT